MKTEDWALLAGGGYLAYKVLTAPPEPKKPDFVADSGAPGAAYVDLGTVVAQLKNLDPIRSNMITALYIGHDALQRAKQLASGSIFSGDITWFGNARDLAWSAIQHAEGGLIYHDGELAAEENPEYGKAEDLKKRVVEAVEAYNMAVAGVSATDRNQGKIVSDYGDFLKETWAQIKELPAAILGTIAKGAGEIIAGAFGGATRGLMAGLLSDPLGIAAIGLVGYYAYKKFVAA